MSQAYGYRMAHDERDQLNTWYLFREAITRRAPVRVSYFKRKKDIQRAPVTDKYGNPVYAKVTRVVEPYELTTTSDGKHIVRVVDRTPEGVNSRPEYRMIRLDRVAVSYRTRLPLVTPMWSYGYLCPTPLDGDELHPNKGELTGQKQGILLAL